MSGSNVKDNKVVLKEDVLVFATGTKIITGVQSAESQIRDMAVNPGDIVITADGEFNIMGSSGFVDPTTGGGGGLDPDLLRVYELTDLEQLTDNPALNITGTETAYAITTSWTSEDTIDSKNLTISTGNTSGENSSSGEISIASGTIGTSGNTGNVTLTSGSTQQGGTGHLTISTGNTQFGSEAGNIYIQTGLNVDTNQNGDVVFTAKNVIINTAKVYIPLLEAIDWNISGTIVSFNSGAQTGDLVQVSHITSGNRIPLTLVLNGSNQVDLVSTPDPGTHIIIHKI